MERPLKLFTELERLESSSLSKLFLMAINYRHLKSEIYFQLAISLNNPVLMKNLITEAPLEALFKCSDLGILSPDQLMLRCHSDLSVSADELSVIKLFLPEMEVFDPKMFKANINNYDPLLKSNNWAPLRQFRKSPDATDVANAIINDNISEFKRLSKKPHFDFDDTTGIETDQTGCPTLLGLAAMYRSTNCFKYLLQKGASPIFTPPETEWNALHYTVACGTDDMLNLLLDRNPSIDGCLVAAATYHQHERLKQFISASLGLNDILDDSSPFGWATMTGNLRGFFILYDSLKPTKAELNTSMWLAAMMNNNDMFRLCVIKGADPNDENEEKQTIMNLSSISPEIVKSDIQLGGDPNHFHKGLAPIHSMAKRGYSENVEALLESGVDPNFPDSKKNTPLHHAVKSDDIDTVRVLLDYGADPLVQNQEGKAAGQLTRNAEILSELQKKRTVKEIEQKVQTKEASVKQDQVINDQKEVAAKSKCCYLY